MNADPLDGLADVLGNLRNGFADTPLGKAAAASRRDSAKPTAPGGLPQIRGKRVDGVLYVHAADVADALESQAPSACARLIRKLRGAR